MSVVVPKKLRSNRRTDRSESRSPSRIEWAVWITVSTTVLGVAAWSAGEAYSSGYWNAVGLTPDPVQHTVQELTFLGFVGNFQNWLWLLLFSAFLGIYGLVLESFTTLKKKSVNPPGRFQIWLKSKISRFKRRSEADPSIIRLFGWILLTSLCLGVIVVIPLGVWISLAEAEGRALMVRQICEVREAIKLPTTVQLSDGKKLNGRLLARSEKIEILLDRTSIYGIQLGEKSVVQDTTDIAMVKCKK